MIQYFEKVKIIACEEYPEYIEMEGYVSSIGIEEDGSVSGYGVRFEDDEIESCDFEPHELEGKGEVLTKDEFDKRFMTDVTLRVGVDEDGNGQIFPPR